MRQEPILVIGATGYVGGRLVPRLLEAGHRVRVMGRSVAKLQARPWAPHPGLAVVQGDVLDEDSLRRAIAGCWAAFYLVHSMNNPKVDFEEADRRAALNMITASEDSSLERIVYLGGLVRECDQPLSKHLRSRCEVAEILRAGPVPLTYFRAAMILGSGSASFEILRYLTDRLPIIPAPKWVGTPVQPISIRNVLHYLTACLDQPATAGETFDIGGPEVLTYRRLIDTYAEVAGLRKRKIFPVGFISPHLSALLLHMITPVPSSISLPLTEGLVNEATCVDDRIRSLLPQELLSCRETIRRALERVQQQRVEGCWTDAGALLPPEWAYCGDETYSGGAIMRCGYSIRLKAEPEAIWRRIVRIGGETGWYYGGSLWRLRGWLDKLFGGTSLSRGRRHPYELYVGDALDFWRVLDLSPPYRLLLLSEMKLPGEALLEFKITPLGNGETELQQLSRFLPKGFLGLLYWYSLYGAHQWLFKGMLSTIAKAVGKPVLSGPRRFTPKLQLSCTYDPSAPRPPVSEKFSAHD